MSKMKNSKKANETAEARMAIIAPLLSPGLDKETVRKLREEIAETSSLSQRTLDRYLQAYHREGFTGLLPEGKNPEARYKIPPEIVEAAIQLRRELPSRSIPTIIEILEVSVQYPVISRRFIAEKSVLSTQKGTDFSLRSK